MRIRYDKTVWVDNETPVDACRLNKIENALEQLFTLAISPSQIEAGSGITIKILDNGNIKFSVSSEPVLDILKAGPGIKIEKVEDDNTIKISSNLDSGNYIDFDLDEETGKITVSSKKQIEEYETTEDFPEMGEDNILYIEKENDKLYYWKEDEYKNLNENTSLLYNTTYENLVDLRNNSKLIPGAWYKIIDYNCTTTQVNTGSANHQFDIIVIADSETELNENARAAHHTGDTYFANCNLEAWELKYCLENDANRFAWADSTNGKGVIFYMKDEWNNECPYDFKNIMFIGSNNNYYTFDALVNSVHYDLSVAQTSRNCYSNTIGVYSELGKNIFRNSTLSSFCCLNTLGNECRGNMFMNGCYGNSLGNYCTNNSFGENCVNNSFGNYCQFNSLGNSCRHNSFKNNCFQITFGNYCREITVFDNVEYCNVDGGTSSSIVKNAQILSGTRGTSSAIRIITFAQNKDYTQVAGLVNGTTLHIWIAEDTVTGPTTSTDSHIAVFDGTTGKVIKDSGLSISDLSPDLVTPITYSDLVSKVGGKLIPGMKYRITDYNTTVSKGLTKVSVANHQFDVIVTALSESELDHHASAIQHEGDTYFSDCDLSKWQLWYDIENDIEKYEWALGDSSSSSGGAKGGIPESAPEYIYSDQIARDLSLKGFSIYLVFQGIETIEIKGENVDCYMYGTSVQAEFLGYVKFFCQEYPVKGVFIYGIKDTDFIYEISPIDIVADSTQPTDGTKVIPISVTTDSVSPELSNLGGDPELTFNGRLILYEGQYCYSYGSDDQYRLLNKRFPGIANIIVPNGISPINPKKASEPGTELVILGSNYDYITDDYIIAVSQETVVVGGTGGTGVIYRMIDEWGNDCPYDFKNILFTRPLTNEHYDPDNGKPTLVYTFNYFIDRLVSDYSINRTDCYCIGNVMNKSFDDNDIHVQILNDNVFLGNIGAPSIYNKLGFDCNHNTFSYGCHNNTFGNSCINNVLDMVCQFNKFGNEFSFNTLSDETSYNTFGSNCMYNIIRSMNHSTVLNNVHYCIIKDSNNDIILSGTSGSDSDHALVISFNTNKYSEVAAINSQDQLVIFNLADVASH